MKIFKQGSLILLFAAFSFFSSAISAALDEQPVKPWIEPKSDLRTTYTCRNPGGTALVTGVKQEECMSFLFSRYVPPVICGNVSGCREITYTNPHTKANSCSSSRCIFQSDRTTKTRVDVNGGTWSYSVYNEKNIDMGYANSPESNSAQTCPPDEAPTYKIGPVQESIEKPNHMVCKPQFTPCPLGFYPHAVSASSGGTESCVPIECPAKGTQMTGTIKNLAGVIPVGGSGTYCDGLCNYSIENGSNLNFVSGVSMGSQCGQSPVKGQKFTPLDKEKNCTEYQLTGADATFLDCQEGTTDEPVPDTTNPAPDVTKAKVDETPVIDPFTGVECTTVDDKMSCVGKNITDALTKQTKDESKLAAERHNKLVEQQKDITAYVEEQQRKREESRKNDTVTMIEAIQEVNRTLQTSGGSTGGGTTGGTDLAVKGAIDALGDGLNNTDVATDSTPSDGIASFYEPEYPNGFQDVWSKNKSLFDNSEMNQYLDSWKLTAAGNAPPMNICFDMGFADYGCKDFQIDPRVFPFLRIIILVLTAFFCRSLIFGG